MGPLAKGCHFSHEPWPRAFQSRRAFRDPAAVKAILAEDKNPYQYLTQRAQKLGQGQSSYMIGWPCFAWPPHFQECFGNAFRFVHLVRNPYVNAASHATHFLINDIPPIHPFDAATKIRAHDPNVAFPGFRQEYAEFGTSECQLVHWLEVTE